MHLGSSGLGSAAARTRTRVRVTRRPGVARARSSDARSLHRTAKRSSKVSLTEGTLAGTPLCFSSPQTYMNQSGAACNRRCRSFTVERATSSSSRRARSAFRRRASEVGGGHAGHNGLRSLIQHLGTPDFIRVRIGVGRPPAGFEGDVADFSFRFRRIERAEFPRSSIGAWHAQGSRRRHRRAMNDSTRDPSVRAAKAARAPAVRGMAPPAKKVGPRVRASLVSRLLARASRGLLAPGHRPWGDPTRDIITCNRSTSAEVAREYETIYVLRSDVDPDTADKVAVPRGRSRRSRQRQARQGRVVGSPQAGLPRRQAEAWRLHLPQVRRARRGRSELERNLRMLDTVLKFQTILPSEDVDIDTVAVDPEEVKFPRIERRPKTRPKSRVRRCSVWSTSGAATPRREDEFGDDAVEVLGRRLDHPRRS